MGINVASWYSGLQHLAALSYTGLVPELIGLVVLEPEDSDVTLFSLASTIMQLLLASSLVFLSHYALNRKEFK